MTESESEREERAFRNAFADHASEAPSVPAMTRPARRRHQVAFLAAAAVAAVVVGAFVAVPALYDGKDSADPPVTGQTTQVDEPEWQWVGLHAVEVVAPINWGFAREAVRP